VRDNDNVEVKEGDRVREVDSDFVRDVETVTDGVTVSDRERVFVSDSE